MSTTVLHTPRFAPQARPVAGGFWSRLWAALEAHGQRRAAAEIRRLSVTHVSTDPVLREVMKDLARGHTPF